MPHICADEIRMMVMALPILGLALNYARLKLRRK